MAGFPTPFPLPPLDPAWGLLQNPFDTQPPQQLQFNNSLKEDIVTTTNDDDTIDDNIDVDGLHDAANFILGNTLHYTPHNFHQPIVIPYPTSCYDSSSTLNTNKRNKKHNTNNNIISLSVCSKCKRHNKTRDICRIKYGHTDVPWTNTYICITIDKSCIDDDGKKYIIRNDHKLYVVVLPSPQQQQQQLLDTNNNNTTTSNNNTTYIANSCFDETTPVCLSCKQSNRTKAYCRKKFRHKELPWNTLFVMLKLQRQHSDVGTSTTLQPSGVSTERDGGGGDGAIMADFLDTTFRDGGEKIEVDNNNKKMPPPLPPALDHLLAAAAAKDEEKKKEAEEPQQSKDQKKEEPKKLEAEFDINCIAPSRTFLSIISSTENSIRWLTNVAADDKSHQQQSSVLNLDESVPTKKKRKKKSKKADASRTASSKKKSKPLDNAALALQAIEYAKQQAKKEQEAALYLARKFSQQTQLTQQQQQLLLQQQEAMYPAVLLQQQQAMYQLQDTAAEQHQRKSTRGNDQSYGDDEMPVAHDLEEINEPEDEDKMPSILNNGEDILDEAAKLAEFL